MKVIIVGAGEVGFHLAEHLSDEQKDIVIIDNAPAAINHVLDNLDVQTITGSGSNPRILLDAGVESADIILAVTSSDETNLATCLSAHMLAPNITKLARIRQSDFEPYYKLLRDNPPNIDLIINPDIEVVKTIEAMMEIPGAVDIATFADGRLKFVGVYLTAHSVLANLQLFELPKLQNGRKLLLAAVIRNEKLIIPRGQDKVLPGDLVYFIAENAQIPEILGFFGRKQMPVKHMLIIGGGRVGYRLALSMESKGVTCKIIEKDQERCSQLSDRLNKTIVICGDGSDEEILHEENIQNMDAVVTLTGDEETNILVSLLARRLGAAKAIVRIDKFSYFPIMSAIGIEQVISPRLSAINSMLQNIRKGKVISSIAIKGEQAEAMETVALETADIVGKPLKDIVFPHNAMVVGLLRGEETIIPDGNTIIVPNDRIIIFAQRDVIDKVEKILAVKLEFF